MERVVLLAPFVDELLVLANEVAPSRRMPWSNKRFFLQAALAFWAFILLVAVSTLMAPHWFTLPRPAPSDPVLVQSLNALRPSGEPGWLAVHVLYSECRCSQRVMDHLFTRAPLENVHEVLLLVGPEGPMTQRARALHPHVVRVDRDALQPRYGIQAVPLMAVLDPSGEVAHLGGYTSRKQGLIVEDVGILESLVTGGHPDELPLYGCATALELAAQLDPLRLRER